MFKKLWRLEGTVGRATYALGGLFAFALKFGIDWSVAHFIFHRGWRLINYWHFADADTTPMMVVAVIAIAIPFVWFGIAMPVLRLRDVGPSALWTAGFFVPVLNL